MQSDPRSRTRSQARARGAAVAVALASFLPSCAARGVGAPCVPEVVPDVDGPGGAPATFDSQEIFVEASSAQCRTRTCVAFRLDGDPRRVVGTDSCPAGTDACVDRDVDIASPISAGRVFCSCRCSGNTGSADAPLCDCGEGFHCVESLRVGPTAVTGGYCVPDVLCDSDGDCASRSCNAATGACNPA
jgi:hypothetical protein